MLFTRPDGTLVRDVPPSRRIMPFIMRGRNESAVFFEQQLELEKTLLFLDRWNAAHPERRAGVFHLFAWAVVRSLAERPRLNRFVSGSRIWQRDGIWISYSAKKKLEDGAPIVALKQRFDPAVSFAQVVESLYLQIEEGRGDQPSHVDKELRLFLALPGPLLRLGVALIRWLDRWNLLPGGFIHPDPMYASIFIANLGSVRLDAAYHHLYEYGNCPFFAALGRTRQEQTAAGPRPVCSVRYTFDERIEDGLYCATGLEALKRRVEDPEAAVIADQCGPG